MVISSTNLTFSMILPSIMLMWINYLTFSLGYHLIKGSRQLELNDQCSKTWILKRKNFSLLLIATFSLLFSIAAARYYTGQTPITIIRNLSNGNPLYYEYYSYFSQQQRYIFSLEKIPFILMLFYVKFVLFYSYVSFFIVKNKTTKFEKFYLGLITLSHIYFGIARGTNFEFFELVMIIIFVILSRNNVRKIQIPLKQLSWVVILVSIMIFVFYNRVIARGISFSPYISRDVLYDPNGLLPLISPSLSFFTLIIYSYFGFGFFYMSKYISELWLSSFDNFIAGFLPFGFYAVKLNGIPSLMNNIVDMGARWHPDTIVLINNIGYLGLLLFCFGLGVFSKYIDNSKFERSIAYLTNFMILMQMISLPVGNFVIVSSASELIVVFLVIHWIWKSFAKVKYYWTY